MVLILMLRKLLSSESSKGLNQVELLKQMLGTWKCEIAKDTFYIVHINCLVTGIEGNY